MKHALQRVWTTFAAGSFSSVLFSRSVVSDSATPWTAARQASLSSPTPGVYSNSCPLSQWGHPTISSSVIPFSSCPQSFPASGSFQMSQLFTSGGCYAQCPNPWAGREKASKTMQLAKKGKFIADSSQGSCRASDAVARDQRALSPSCYPIYKVCISSW